MELSATAYVILGMLRLGAQSGYDIKRWVEVSTSVFWTISQAQIYPTLAQLEELQLVEGRSEPTGKRRRRVYEPTDAGLEALRQWLTNGEPLGFDVRDVAMLKLFFAGVLEDADGTELVRTIGRRSEAEIERLKRESEAPARESDAGGDPFPLITLRMGLAVHETLVEFSRQLEQELMQKQS
ncbi:MAG TPA: PadR family transcriptional regulator [Thermoleophilaceae bacterium]